MRWFWDLYPLWLVLALCAGQGLVLRRRKRQRERWAAERAELDEALAFPLRTDGRAGMPCSDCCHARFGEVPRRILNVTINWPCTRCGKTIRELGGYHHRETCGTDFNVMWPGKPDPVVPVR